MPLKLMKALLWHVRCKDLFGSWPWVGTATQSAGLYDDHSMSACNVKDEEAKRKATKAGKVSWGVQDGTCRCSRVKHV